MLRLLDPNSFGSIVWDPKIVSPKEVKRLRKQLSHSGRVKELKRRAAREMFGRYPQELIELVLTAFQVHHIVPLSMGGNNEIENLALLDPLTHFRVHNHNNLQREYAGAILLPKHPRNKKVWLWAGTLAP